MSESKAGSILLLISGNTVLPRGVTGSNIVDHNYNLSRHLTYRNNTKLSPQELATIKMAFAGLSNKMIAEKIGVSERTVKGYMCTIFNKLGANSRTEAVSKALQAGLISVEHGDVI